jgi:hypothetical protein
LVGFNWFSMARRLETSLTLSTSTLFKNSERRRV